MATLRSHFINRYNRLKEKFAPGPRFEPRSLALRAGDLDSNPGPGANFSLMY